MRKDETRATTRGRQSGTAGQKTVAVPLFALAAIVSLLVIAFFVGRESARKDPVPAAAVAKGPAPPSAVGSGRDPVGASDPRIPEAPVGEEVGSLPRNFESLFPPELNTDPHPGDRASDGRMPSQSYTGRPPLQGGAPAGGAANTAVAAYFRELDSVEGEAKYWSNPQDLAMTLLGQVGNGDTSGFDRLVVSQQRALDRVRRISPPPPCVDHHRRVVSLMGRGVSLLQTVSAAAVAGDAGGLMALPNQAQELETEARQVDALGEQIRQRFGVAG